MPEIKHTFTGGKMNKDLDERLIPQGQYRNAMNVQIRTSDGGIEGDGDSGTVQNIQGNTLVGSSYYEDWMSSGVSEKPEDSLMPNCVGSVVDEKNDKAYFFFASSLVPPKWDEVGMMEDQERVYVDTIIEQGVNGINVPVLVDVFGIVVPRFELLPGNPDLHSDLFPGGSGGGWSQIKINPGYGHKFRPGMKIDVRDGNGQSVLPVDKGLLKIKAVDGENILLYEECYTNVVDEGGKWFVFKAPRVLAFNPSGFLSETQNLNNYITGINIIDNLLFWTDSYSEPKKINIKRCKAGTNINGVANDLRTHTKLFIEHPVDKQLVDAATIDYGLDGGGNSNGSGLDSYIKEEHITVLRQAPRSAPTLKMSDTTRPGTRVSGIDFVFPIINDEEMQSGHNFSITNNAFLQTQYLPNDILIIQEYGDVSDPVSLEARFVGYEENLESGTFLSGTAGAKIVRDATSIIRIEIIREAETTESTNSWSFKLKDDKKPLFELKLARFGYRYKYTDGEYSSFSPWSEVAFLPGEFKYTSEDGYNLGMVNTVRRLVVQDFIPYKRPLDLAAVEILYKTTDSPNVYVVDTIEKEKDSQWKMFTPDGSPFTTEIKTGSLTISSEMIHRVLESTQILRSWDNVPRRAKAQEIVGNRLTYANYTQGYNINKTVNLTQEVKSKTINIEDKPQKSIKSLRDYKVGMVFGDKYGRETPVIPSNYTTVTNAMEDFISTTGDISIPKSLCGSANSFLVTQSWGDPNSPDIPPTISNGGWIDYVKYYVKETSNEYYNLVMDRWYPSGDGAYGRSSSLWLSFNSADRNKIDDDTYLILKNSHGSNIPVLEDARYKILAIENEAPDFIKTDNIPIGELGAPGISPNITGDSSSGSYDGTWWNENESDTITTEAPGLLAYNTEMMININAWNHYGVGYVNEENPTNVFGKEITGKIEFRIVGVNNASGIVTGKVYSEWREITAYSFVNNEGANTDYVYLKWDREFDLSDIDMKSRFIAIANNNSDFNINNLQYWVEFREAIVKNKPEFDGKFFVKIQMNDQVDTNVTFFNINSSWSIKDTYKLRYIESSYQNKHEMDSAQTNTITGVAVEETADFLDPEQTWFYGYFDNFLWGDGDFSGTDAQFNQAFDNASESLSFMNWSAAYPTGPHINEEGDQELGTPGLPDLESYSSSLLDTVELGPFGSCSYNYNEMATDFWQKYVDENWIDGPGNSDVFIDGCGMARMHIRPGPDRELLGRTTGGMEGDLGDVGGPDAYSEWDGRFKPTSVLTVGEGIVPMPDGPIGASDGTKGSICLSYVAGYTTTNHYSGSGPASYENEFMAQMRTPGTVFQFPDHPDPNARFRVAGVMYKSSNINENPRQRNVWSASSCGYYVDPLDNPVQADNFTNCWTGDCTHENLCVNYNWTGFPSAHWIKYKQRITAYIEFRRIDEVGNMLSIGLDTSEFDPRAFMHHDGRDYISVNILTLDYTSTQGPSQPTQHGAVWETEPKESAANLDLYYEASSAIPMNLREDNVFDFIPINSKVEATRPTQGNTNVVTSSSSRINPRVNNIHFGNPGSKTAILSIISTDVSYTYDEENNLVQSSTFGQPFLHRRDFTIGDKLYFEHANGTITSADITQMYKPVFITDSNGDGYGDDGFTAITSEDIQYGVVSGPKAFEPAGTHAVSASFQDPGNGYFIYVPDATLSQIAIGDIIAGAVQSVNGVDQFVPFGTAAGTAPAGIQFVGSESIGSGLSKLKWSMRLNEWLFPYLDPAEADNLAITILFQRNYGYYGINTDVWDQQVKLPWHNCWTFGNGVESDRIRDDFNAPQLDNGVRVSTTFSGYKKETIKSGLIYSGLYNSTSQVNNLNEFNMAEKITKELNPSYGSIQALKTRDTDIVVLAEDKILKVLANKDALYNADGNPQLTATNRVLGTTIPFAGDYGISRNPESLAQDQYRLYFTDRQRGAVLRLSRDGLTPISNVGMKNWFRDKLKKSNMLLGSFDSVAGEYNLTIKTPTNISWKYKTVSFDEANKGWVSFKSFIPQSGVSCSGSYLTAKHHQIWKHHVPRTLSGQALERNRFYWDDPVDSTVTVVFNEAPNLVKSFKSVSYEGSQARITKLTSEDAVTYTGQINYTEQVGDDSEIVSIPFEGETLQMTISDNEYYNLNSKDGWWIPAMHTDLQIGKVPEFIKKEGKWFNKISGVNIGNSAENIDPSEFTVQGLGTVNYVFHTGVEIDNTEPCLDINGVEVDCNSADCVTGPCTYDPPGCIYGCTDPSFPQYDELATCDDGSCSPVPISDCMDPENPAYNPNATVHVQDMCDDVTIGCMDPTATNYNPSATMDGQYFDLTDPFTGTTTTEFVQCWNNCSCTYDNNTDYDCPINTVWDPITEQCVSLSCPTCDICYDEDGNMVACDDEDVIPECEAGFIWEGSAESGQCVQQVYGCMDVYAVNYMGPNLSYQWPNDSYGGYANTNGVTYDGFNPDTGEPDSAYAPANTPCEGCCEYPPDQPLQGCMDPLACNYCGEGNDNGIYPYCTYGPDNPDDDDALNWCAYDCIGCMDYNAFNFNPLATQPCYDNSNPPVENGYGGDCCMEMLGGSGCTDPAALNHCEECIIEDGSCVYLEEAECDCENDSDPEACFGCTDPTADNYCECCTHNQVSSTDAVTNPCNSVEGDILGCTTEGMWNYDPTANIDDGSCIPVIEGCMDSTMLNYELSANEPCDDCCIPFVYGCTDSTMWNFDPYANSNEGVTCINIIYGCQDPLADNYNSNAHTNYYDVFDHDCWDDCQGGAHELECLETCWTYGNTEIVPCEYSDLGPMEIINYPDDSEAAISSSTNPWLLDLDADAYEGDGADYTE